MQWMCGEPSQTPQPPGRQGLRHLLTPTLNPQAEAAYIISVIESEASERLPLTLTLWLTVTPWLTLTPWLSLTH